MDSNTEDHVGTLIKVNQFCKDNSGALASNPNIAAEQTTLESDTERIFQNDSIHTRPLEGYTQMKTNARKDLQTIVLLVRAGCIGYYTANPNPGKLMIVNWPDTKIQEDRDKIVYTMADQVHDVADPIKTLLAPFQVTSADVDSIPTRMTAYKDVLELPRTEEGISVAAGKERDRIYQKCFEEVTGTLAKIDNYMLPFKYTNTILYDKYKVASAIDNSGGGADTNGYDVHNTELAPGQSKSFHAGVAPTQQLYFRQIGGTVSVIVCTAALATDACAAGFTLTPGVTVKKTFAELGLAAGNFINFTNPGSETVTVRAGLKSA